MTRNLLRAGLVLAALGLSGGTARAQTPNGCGKGTVCRQAIEGGFANCKAAARSKWQMIAQLCKAAKRAKNLAPCRQAILAGYASSVAGVDVAPARLVPAVTCTVGTPCGNGCCPTDFPVCGSQGDCCPAAEPVDCGNFNCCPSDFPICGVDACHGVGTTTTTVPDCGGPTTTLPSGTCQNPGDDCNPGCLIYPSGVCAVRCTAGGPLFCAGGITSFEVCTTDADCPPAGLPALRNNTICVTPGLLTDPATCAGGQGHCAEPCP